METVMAENARLRQRLEELQEIVDTQAPAATASSAPKEGIGSRRGARSRDSTAAAATVGPGAGTPAAAAAAATAASDAILRGQLAQLRRQVRLQWCAVDASSAVTQELSF